MAECPLHPELVRQVNLIIENQGIYMDKQIDMIKDLTYIKTTMDNGLKTKVGEAHEAIQDLKDKMDCLDDFQWFREMVNGLRNNLFKNVCKSAFYGGLIIFIGSAVFVVGEKVWTNFLHYLK